MFNNTIIKTISIRELFAKIVICFIIIFIIEINNYILTTIIVFELFIKYYLRSQYLLIRLCVPGNQNIFREIV